MKINYDLGYKPVHFSELTDDPDFGKDAKPAKTLMSLLEQNANSVCALVCYMIKRKKQTQSKTTSF